MNVTHDEKRACIEREIKMRRRVYPRRVELRHAGINMVRTTFRGFIAALPAPGAAHWTTILGVGPDATPDQITAAYREKARALGATGNEEARTELNVARDKALAERTAG